jgi:hypothetical protein
MPDQFGNPTPLDTAMGQSAGVQSGLQQQALSQQMQQFLLALQFQQQQAALGQASNYATQYGNAPGGNYMTWGAGGPTQPQAGSETLNALAQQFGMGTSAAALTGQFANPQTYQFQPGTYIRNADTGQIGQVGPNGVLQTLNAPPAGVNPNTFPSIPTYNFSLLQQGQGTPTQTLPATAQAGSLASQQAALTGMYQQPMGNAAADAFNTKASPQTQQAYLQQYQGDPAAAAAHYWQDVQGAIAASGQTPQQFVYGTSGPTPTMQLQQLYGTYGAPQQGQQTLEAQNQQAQLSGMYNGAPTEAASEFSRNLAQQMQQFQQTFGLSQGQLTGQYNGAPTEAASEFARNLALQQGQLGQQYLSTAAQLQGPQNTFQLSNYMRGAAANPNVPVYLQNLQNNMGMPSFQGTGGQAPTPASMGGLAAGMGYGSPASGTGTDTSGGATAGWNYGDTLNSIKGITSSGAQSLGPGSLERLSPDELGAFGSGLGAAGYSLPSFMQQYQNSRVGQQAPTAQTALT